MDPDHFRAYVIDPTLKELGLHSEAASNLLLGTALHESGGLQYLKQIKGPALGVYQVEPDTHQDVWLNFLAFRPSLSGKINRMLGLVPSREDQLITNLAYATAIARLVYYRSPDPLPDAFDAEGLARYHETVFNTRLGAIGRTPDTLEALSSFQTACTPS